MNDEPTRSSLVAVANPAVADRDAVHRGESEPGAVTRLLGGAERFEDACPRCFAHPGARVGDGELHERSRRDVVDRGLGRFDRHAGGIRVEFAPAGHRLAGVDQAGLVPAAPGEREKLVCERGSSLGERPHLLQRVGRLRVGGQSQFE
jgi:hypothetical protein